MTYSRTMPSSRYRELIDQYCQLHVEGERKLGIPPGKTFNGQSLLPHVVRIRQLIERTGALTLLDYGCGKGQQYEPTPCVGENGKSYDGVIDYWDVDAVHCYDPGYAPYSELPAGSFDGVICTDVLEHCPQDDLPWIVGELFGYARQFVYANVACYPAMKHLPSGENAHCTVQPVAWWEELFARCTADRPGLVWDVWVEFIEQTPEGPSRRQQRVGS